MNPDKDPYLEARGWMLVLVIVVVCGVALLSATW
jgi:hypothetical protein